MHWLGSVERDSQTLVCVFPSVDSASTLTSAMWTGIEHSTPSPSSVLPQTSLVLPSSSLLAPLSRRLHLHRPPVCLPHRIEIPRLPATAQQNCLPPHLYLLSLPAHLRFSTITFVFLHLATHLLTLRYTCLDTTVLGDVDAGW